MQLAKDVKEPETTSNYPAAMDTRAKQALYDNLDHDADRYSSPLYQEGQLPGAPVT